MQEGNEGHSSLSKIEQCDFDGVTSATAAQNNFYNAETEIFKLAVNLERLLMVACDLGAGHEN